MRLPSKEAVGVRYTGWAALGRDPQEDTLEYTCPYCGEHGVKAAGALLTNTTLRMDSCRTCKEKWRHAGHAGIRCGLRPWFCCTIRTRSAGSKAYFRMTWSPSKN